METQAWSDVFSTSLQRAAVSPDALAQIYKLDMEACIFFDWGC